MPRIPDQYLDCVVYLYPSETEAYAGEKIGGSGFLLVIPLVESYGLVCVVTNKHVIDDGAMTARLNTQAGEIDVVPLDGSKWYLHPNGDDLAICPVGINSKFHRFFCINIHNFSDNAGLAHLQIGVGDEVFVVGRFISKEGRQKNTPTARFGTIAQMPIEPLRDETGRPQESYLIEARSIGGFIPKL